MNAVDEKRDGSSVVRSASSTGRVGRRKASDASMNGGLSAQDKRLLLHMGLMLAIAASILSWAIVGHWLGALAWLLYLPPYSFGMSECHCDDEDTAQDRLQAASDESAREGGGGRPGQGA